MKFTTVDAGFTDVVFSLRLQKAIHKIDVFESRDYFSGIFYSEQDQKSDTNHNR